MKAASLNHVYRLIWSKIQHAWVAVAETARSQGKSSVNGHVSDASVSGSRFIRGMSFTTDTKWRFVIASAFAAAMLPQVASAFDNPIHSVPVGDITVIKHSDTYTENIHHSTINVVNYYEFNVLAGQRLDVNMVNGGSSLYRVVGNNASQILGTLNSNGSLFLVNQNGILFGNGAEVNVGNIVASSMDISNDDFVKGNYRFVAGSVLGAVENRGVIKSQNEGYIVLLGNTVNNSGTLVANNGSVVLGSAQEATLDFFGNGLVKAKLSGDALEATVKNSGFIQADGGLVQLATNARAAAINISGIVEANQLVERDGVIRLEGGDNAKVQVSGKLLAKGEQTTGGTIEVTGEQVALLDGALLDASGDTGGGKVLVGGDYQGKNAAVYNSRTAYIASGATIKADATQEGDGGKVIVWADDLTRYYGNISAQGGSVSGNGGFVEVSGKENLDFHGKVNVAAANGLGGTLLLDPTNIVLSSTGSTLADNPDGDGFPDIEFNDPGTTTTVNIADVSGFSELFLQANNDITISDPLSMTNPMGNIRFEAKNDIHATGKGEGGFVAGSVMMKANNDIHVNAEIKSGFIGSVRLIADADNFDGGNIAIGANISGGSGIFNAGEGVFLSAATISHTAGNISSTADVASGIGGSITIKTTGAANLGSANIISQGQAVVGAVAGGNAGGAVFIDANSLTMSGKIDASGSVSTDASESGGQGGKVTINTVNNASVGDIVTTSGAAGTGSSGPSALSSPVSIVSANGSIRTGDINSNGGANNIGADVTLIAATSVTTGDINTSAGLANSDTDGKSAGAVSITAGTNIKVGEITAKGANGNGTNKAGGNAGVVTLKATAGDIDMGAIDNRIGTPTGNGKAGLTATILAQAGQDIIVNGDIKNSHAGTDAVQLVAGGVFDNTKDIDITTPGKWTIYSDHPVASLEGTTLKSTTRYDYVQYGSVFGDALQYNVQNPGNPGNGFVYKIVPTIVADLSGTSTKVFDGNNIVTDLSGLIVSPSITYNGTPLSDKVTLSPLVGATFNDSAVGTGKPITSSFTLVDLKTAEDKPVFLLGGQSVTTLSVATNSTATGSITPAPLGFASPRDDAGLGGLIPNNPVLNTMFIVSLNPAAGDEEDLDAVACPLNEDSLGSTPILNSGVKLPDGVSSNCI